MNFGVQTFTIRRAQKKSIRNSYLPLIKLGIKSFEVARINFCEEEADELLALKNEYGIEISAIQVKPKCVFGDPEKIIRFCKTTGCKRVVISMLPFGCILGSEERFFSFADSLDSYFDKYAEHGITLAYHHHNWEYIKLSTGRTRMEELLLRSERIMFVHDTYWTARCGISPASQIAAFKNRLLGIHLRDLTFRKRGIDVLSCDAAIGDGVIDFSEVLSAAERAGCSYLVIEQKTANPYSEIEKSYGNLIKIASSAIKE